jgi:uncharacterized protein YggU (UPF0235/DUF167 family)
MAQIKVKVDCGAIAEAVVWKYDTDSMLVSITHHSTDGIANKYITEYLSTVLDMPMGKINVIKGLDKPNKTIEVDNSINVIKEKIMVFNNN